MLIDPFHLFLILINLPFLWVIRKAVNDYRELKLLLDMYKGVGKEQRDKVQLMAAEKKARQEVEELKAQVSKDSVVFIDLVVLM